MLIIQSKEALNQELAAFLEKIMQAVNCSLNKDILMCLAAPEKSLSFVDIAKGYDIQKVIIFGMLPKRLGLNFKATLYTPLSIGAIEFFICQ